MKFSAFGTRLTNSNIGITRLMEDLAQGLQKTGQLMLGGGNPGYVPEVLDRLQQQLQEVANDRRLVQNLLADYSEPAGDGAFRQVLAEQLRHKYGWDIGAANIALTNGSQSAFFSLFNLFAGQSTTDNTHILLPLVPEYIGYQDISISPGMFRAVAPKYEIDEQSKYFKYAIDWDALSVNESTAALCVSRPCNPTGNVITDSELQGLHALAKQADIPLIIDNAYGDPFPSILFSECQLMFDEHCILVMSLSKFGLPASRTGIVIASESIVHRIAAMNGVLALAPSAIGARLLTGMMQSGEVFDLSRNAIRPFYQRKAEKASALLLELLRGYPCYLHQVEGGIFLWLWCKDLPCSDSELYQRLLHKLVTVVPGRYFFTGLEHIHEHQYSAIRISYAADDDTVRQGVEIIAQEIRELYGAS